MGFTTGTFEKWPDFTWDEFLARTGRKHPALRNRVGDYVLLAKGSYAFASTVPGSTPAFNVGNHGGMSPGAGSAVRPLVLAAFAGGITSQGPVDPEGNPSVLLQLVAPPGRKSLNLLLRPLASRAC